MKKFLLAIVMALLAIASSQAQDLYLRGVMNNWNVDPAYKFTENDGTYTLSVDNFAANQEFKIAQSDWDQPHYGGSSSGISVQLGSPYILKEKGENLKLAEGGNLTFTFVQDTKTLTVTANTPVTTSDLYVRGEMNSWSTEDDWKFTTTDNINYTLSNVNIENGTKFKIADKDWSDNDNYGGAENVGIEINTSDKEYDLVQGGGSDNITLNIDGIGRQRREGSSDIIVTVTLIFNKSAKTLKVIKGEEIIVDELEDQYIYFYNTENWETPAVYLWNNEGSKNANFPGEKFDYTKDLTLGNDSKPYYRKEVGEYTMCIFNDGQPETNNKTNDLTIQRGYRYDGTVNGNGNPAEFSGYDGVGGIFLVGTMNDEKVEARWRFSLVDNVLTINASLDGPQSFKVYEVVGNTLHVYGGGALNYGTPLTVQEGLSTPYITLAKGCSDVTFTFDKTTKKLTVVNNAPDEEDPVESPERYVYFKNTKGWQDVYCYAWDNNNTSNSNGWPGKKLDQPEDKVIIDGVTYYKFELTNINWTHVIFNKGTVGVNEGNQTKDFDFKDNRIYTYDGATEDAIENGKIVPATNVKYYQILGNIVDGSDSQYNMEEIEDGKWLFNGSLRSGKFKIQYIQGGSAPKTYSPSDSNNINAEGTYNLVEGGEGEFTFSLSGDYTLTLDPEAKTLVVESSPLYLRGEMNDWACKDAWKFTRNLDGTYTLAKVPVHADADFKISGRNWTPTYAGAGMISFGETVTLVEHQDAADCYLYEGSDKVTFDFNPVTKKLTVTNEADSVHPAKFIYFRNTGKWDKVYCHLSDAAGNKNGDRGIKLNNLVVGRDGKTYYRAHVDDFTSVYFTSDGAEANKTDTWDVVENKIYNATENTGIDFFELEPANSEDRFYYYFEKTDDWGDVYAYGWTVDEETLGSWPGKKLTRLNGNIYVLGSDVDITNVFFNNGAATDYRQTVNILDAIPDHKYKPTTTNTDGKWEVEDVEYNASDELEGLVVMSVDAPLSINEDQTVVTGTIIHKEGEPDVFKVNFDLANKVGLQIVWNIVGEVDGAEWNLANVSTPYAEISAGKGTLYVKAVRGTLSSTLREVTYDVKVMGAPVFELEYISMNETEDGNEYTVLNNTEVTITCENAAKIKYFIDNDDEYTVDGTSASFTVTRGCSVIAYGITAGEVDGVHASASFIIKDDEVPLVDVLNFVENSYGLTLNGDNAGKTLTDTKYTYTVTDATLIEEDGVKSLSFAPKSKLTVQAPFGYVIETIEVGAVTGDEFTPQPTDLNCKINHGRVDGFIANDTTYTINAPAVRVTLSKAVLPEDFHSYEPELITNDKVEEKGHDGIVIRKRKNLEDDGTQLYDVWIKIPADCFLYYQYSQTQSTSNAPRRVVDHGEFSQATPLEANPKQNLTDDNVHRFAVPASEVSYYAYHPSTDTVGDTKNVTVNEGNSITTGVEDIVVDGAEEGVYYNLQGLRVENPAHGIYIRVVGGKAVKVAL